MEYWQSIYIKYERHNITNIDIDANNRNEIMIISTSNIGSYNDSPMITNNNNNDNHYKSNYNKIHNHRTKRKEVEYSKEKGIK